jgi:septation ring formation regulator, ezrA
MKILYDFSLISVLISIAILIVFILFLFFSKKRKDKKLKQKIIEELDYNKNILDTYPIENELVKVETLIKNEKLEEQYKIWQERFKKIKDENVVNLNEIVLKLDTQNVENFNELKEDAKRELYKAKFLLSKLLEEIEDVNMSEEKYRTLIIKLKTKYRELNDYYEAHKKEYGELENVVEMQFENIEKRFQIFEEFMETNDYSEVIHIVKSIDLMLEHMQDVVKKLPDLVIVAHKIIPLKIEELTNIYEKMILDNYNLKELNVTTNLENALKSTNELVEKVKGLNFKDVEVEFEAIVEYLDDLFKVFETEQIARKEYSKLKILFEKKLIKTNKIVSSVYKELDSIRSMYNLKAEEIDSLNVVKTRLMEVNDNYKKIITDLKSQETNFLTANKELIDVNSILIELSDDLDKLLKSLGNMYEDEQRAREQLNEIEKLLRDSKGILNKYNFPSVNKELFIEIKEANEAVYEVIKELKEKPIKINTLNTRVDTARDLALKVYTHVNDMLKKMEVIEELIVFANKYRSESEIISDNLNKASNFFFQGNYNKSLDVLEKALINKIPNIEEIIKLKLK